MLAAESLVFLTYDDNGVYVVIWCKSRSTRKVDVTGGLSPSVIIRIEGSPRLSVGEAVIEGGRLVLLAGAAQLGGKAAAHRVRACLSLDPPTILWGVFPVQSLPEEFPRRIRA
jgi:hypothetical protein